MINMSEPISQIANYNQIVEILLQHEEISIPFKSCLWMKEFVFSNDAHRENVGYFPWETHPWNDSEGNSNGQNILSLFFNPLVEVNRPFFALTDLLFEEFMFYNNYWWCEFQQMHDSKLQLSKFVDNGRFDNVGAMINNVHHMSFQSVRDITKGYLQHVSPDLWQVLINSEYQWLFQSMEDRVANRGSLTFGWPMFFTHTRRSDMFLTDRRCPRPIGNHGQYGDRRVFTPVPQMGNKLPAFISGIKYEDLIYLQDHPHRTFDGIILDFIRPTDDGRLKEVPTYRSIKLRRGSTLKIKVETYNASEVFVSDSEEM
jgi:hypothetical protein